MSKNKNSKSVSKSGKSADKSAAKNSSKESSKSLKKDTKSSLVAKSSAKSGSKPVAKSGPGKAPAKEIVKKAAKSEEKDQSHKKVSADKSDKSTLIAKGKKAKKTPAKGQPKNQEDELDDTLLADDDGLGGEEIPDLEEFDELEEIAEEPEAEVENEVLAVEVETESISVRSPDEDDEIILTDAEGRRLCRIKDCDQAASVDIYCRFHYLLNWKRIQVRRTILNDGKLEKYVDDLTGRYPDKFLEMIRKDLRTEKEFLAAIAELEIDESGLDNEFEDESQNFIDEVRGVGGGESISEEEEF